MSLSVMNYFFRKIIYMYISELIPFAGHLQRLVHNQLPGPVGQSDPRQLRDHRGSHDHRACHHGHPKDRGRSVRKVVA